MKLLKQLRFILVWMVPCALILLVEMTVGNGTMIGAFINQFHPCVQIETNSFPCYAIYDIGAELVLAFVVLYSTVIIGKISMIYFSNVRAKK